MDEILQASRVLKDVTRCDKLNIAAIGNVVPQLHVHIVARWINDPLWPKPVWGAAPPRPGDASGFRALSCRDRRSAGHCRGEFDRAGERQNSSEDCGPTGQPAASMQRFAAGAN